MSINTGEIYRKIKNNITSVIVGKGETVDLLICALMCGGHVLIEDVPGTGKTTLVKSLAASVDCEYNRIQFTPDLLPSDITGINFFNMKKSEFEFMPGPVFTNILLADEINRATPKTQSGLLECMEERQTTVDGKTYKMKYPFMTVATQNPIESMGVFPLPEAQLDRFMFRIPMSYPDTDGSVEILKRFSKNTDINITPVASAKDILDCRRQIEDIFVHEDLMRYAVRLCEATRALDGVELGVSPRGTLVLMYAAKGIAAIAGRDHVLPDDIKRAAVPVMAHRLIMNDSARIKQGASEAAVGAVLEAIPVPTENADYYSAKI